MQAIQTVKQRRYVKYTPRIRKNAQGGLKQSKAVSALMTPILHYDRPGSNFSVYCIFETYLELVPRCGPFYRKPLYGMRFSANSISQRDLKGMMRRFFSEAGISLENRTISNHFGRVTLCSTLYNQKFSDKSVMSRSKHASNSVHVYQKEDFGLIDDICSALEPPLPARSTLKTEPGAMQEHSPLREINNNIPTIKTEKHSESQQLEITVPPSINVIVINKEGKKMKIEL